jgi:hypothetical protein
MSRPAKTSVIVVLTADSDKNSGGVSSLQKSILVNHLAVAAAGAGSEAEATIRFPFDGFITC